MNRIVLALSAALAAFFATPEPASAQAGSCWVGGQRYPAHLCRPYAAPPRPPVVVVAPPRNDWRWRNTRYNRRPSVTVAIQPGRPAFRPGVYRPQPLKPPRQIRVGGPNCGGKGDFNPQLGVCVSKEITRIELPPEHKAYLAGCPGTIETRVIPRGGVMVEQQRCNHGLR